VDEEKPGIYLWMKRAWKTPPGEEEPGSHPWMKESLELTCGRRKV
jgi:hypothetical protein